MTRCFLYIVFFAGISPGLYAQPVLGKIKADLSFHCREYSFVDPLYGRGFFMDSLYGIPKICDSKNDIEIRLSTTYAPTGFFNFSLFAFDGSKWSAKNYLFNFGDTIWYDTAYNTKQGSVVITDFPANSINIMFDLLTRNNIFTLPNQSEIPVKKLMTCGVMYVLTFKIGNRFRTYQFNNAKDYHKEYPRRKEFENYTNIIHIMNKYGLEN
jgi:hypothetical protein